MLVKWRVLEILEPESEHPWVVVQMSIDHGDGWRIVASRMQLEVGEYQMIGAGLALGLSQLDSKRFPMIHDDDVFKRWVRRSGNG